MAAPTQDLNHTNVIGAAVTNFTKPATNDNGLAALIYESGRAAIDDAGVDADAIDHVVVCSCQGDPVESERGVQSLGLVGVPVVHVGASGAAALYVGASLIASGRAKCVAVLAGERMTSGGLGARFPAAKQSAARTTAPQLFAEAGQEYASRYGVDALVFAEIAAKNHAHATRNVNALQRGGHSLEDIVSSAMVSPPLTKLQCCPNADGGAAVVLGDDTIVARHDLSSRTVRLRGQVMMGVAVQDGPDSALNRVGFERTRLAAEKLYATCGIKPADADVLEVHDCFSTNELLAYDALGLCAPGEAAGLVADRSTTYGGRWVVNPSGGLIGRGHALGATALAQAVELTKQLRGEAGERQVADAGVALQHTLGIGGSAVLTAYERTDAR